MVVGICLVENHLHAVNFIVYHQPLDELFGAVSMTSNLIQIVGPETLSCIPLLRNVCLSLILTSLS
jgi:hypothetical protein